ncbi:MAG: hypothetical protein ABJB85_10270 [Nitrososphaerota archaeon]
MYNIHMVNVTKGFRNMCTSHEKLKFLSSICGKEMSYDEALSAVIEKAKPFFVKGVAIQ